MPARNPNWVVAAVGLCATVLAQATPDNQAGTHSASNPSTMPTSQPESDDYEKLLERSDRNFAEEQKALLAATKATASSTLPEPATQPADTKAGAEDQTATTAAVQSRPELRTIAGPNPGPQDQGTVVVNSDLDSARSYIAPALGAQTYTIGTDQIESTPGGENATGQQVLLRAPGVVEDSYGQEHVRGEHANLTYRVNGVILPEGLNGFGQELDTRLIRSLTLIDGSLPAQFGFRTAGIVDVQTKSGESLKSTEVSIYGGSNETYQPSFQTGGSVGKLDYFAAGSLLHNDLGIESPTSGYQAIHDRTNQQRLFGYASYRLDSTSRVSVLMNGSNTDFQIPNTPGLTPAYPLAGHPGALYADSTGINENQNEQQYYAALAYQKTLGRFSFQAAAFTRYGSIHFTPDTFNDLIFQGVAGAVRNNFFTNGAQIDSAFILNDHHTLRAGLLADFTTERLETSTGLFATDPGTGAVTSDVPITIADNSGNHGVSAGVYVQDEWSITKKLTLNYGIRYDRFDTNFIDAGQLSPRANLVYKLTPATTLHAGYARYFVPPPLQYVGARTVSKFDRTTNAAGSVVSGPLKVERSNYFDLGVSRQMTKAWSVSVDGFYKDAHNLVDNGQFGSAVIITPFNYRLGQVFGAELSSNYTAGPFSAFGNFSYVNTLGKDIISQQYLFGADELAFIHDHYIKLDHEGQYTASLGCSFTWHQSKFYIDAIYGSGLRRGFANGQKEQEYFPVNIGLQQQFKVSGSGNVVTLRVDILNVFDEHYQLRDGSGVGVAAAQYAPHRAIFGGLSYAF